MACKQWKGRLGSLEGAYNQVADRLNSIDSRLNVIETRIEHMDSRLNEKSDPVYDSLNEKIDRVFEQLNAKIDALGDALRARMDRQLAWILGTIVASSIAVTGAVIGSMEALISISNAAHRRPASRYQGPPEPSL